MPGMINMCSFGTVFALCALAAFAAQAQTPANAPAKTRSMASLIADGYEMSDIRVFPDKIWMRKPGGETMAFICDRGRIGSPAFDAYRAKRYDEISCSPAQ
jgi:hypothetical protein